MQKQGKQNHNSNRDQGSSLSEQSSEKSQDKSQNVQAQGSADRSSDQASGGQQAAGEQKGAQQGDQKADQKADQQQAGGKSSGNLPEIFEKFNTDEVKRYAERAFTYAEAKPMQTIGLTVATGAVVGWLLSSRSARSSVASVGTIVMPFISSWVKQNVDFSKIGQEITNVVHH